MTKKRRSRDTTGMPLIGITTSVTIDSYPERAYLNAAYINAVQQAGGIPVPLPPHLGREALDHLWPRLAGVVLTGGGDVDPSRFGASRHPSVFDVSPARDALEIDLTRRALDGGRPLLAICRGIQVVNVALGGTLHQDIPSDVDSAINHSQKEPRDQPTHAVKVNIESGLGALLGAAELAVNSFHHQAIDRAGAGIRDVVWAPDGVIEGVEVADHPFLFGVQWHPEDLVGHDAAARRLFRALAEAAERQTVRTE